MLNDNCVFTWKLISAYQRPARFYTYCFVRRQRCVRAEEKKILTLVVSEDFRERDMEKNTKYGMYPLQFLKYFKCLYFYCVCVIVHGVQKMVSDALDLEYR